MATAADELVEVLAEDGTVERVVTRAEMRAENLRHRNIAIFVRRSDGRLVVHQRAEWKDLYPSLWDVAFGGVPGVGEPDRACAVRELAEEAGLVVDESDLWLLGTRSEQTDTVSWVGTFYGLMTDAALTPVDGEVAAIEAVDPADIDEWARSHPLCPDVASLLDLLDSWPDDIARSRSTD